MDLRLTGIFCWRRVYELGYLPLESFLSVEPMLDEALICVDPDGAETMNLVNAIAKKFPDKVRVVEFSWPIGKTGDGSVIGIASNYALQQVRTSHVVNVQSDEIWPVALMNWTKDSWRNLVASGMECIQYKILHCEHNAQLLQGGVQWSGRKDALEWAWQPGAGYNVSVKLSKRCPAIKFAHDGWTFENCHPTFPCYFSNNTPIVHLHDHFRDALVKIRRNAADTLWTDQVHFGHYKASADNIEATKDAWWDDPLWTRTTSPFAELLPDFVKPLIGSTAYRVNWQLLSDWPDYKG